MIAYAAVLTASTAAIMVREAGFVASVAKMIASSRATCASVREILASAANVRNGQLCPFYIYAETLAS